MQNTKNQTILALLALVLFTYGLIRGGFDASLERSPASLRDEGKSSTLGSVKKWFDNRDFSKFRPAQNKDEFRYLQLMPEKTTIEEIYSPEKTREMQAKYNASLSPLEQKVNNPYRMARMDDMERYSSRRQEFASWAAREVLNEKMRMILGGADKDSKPVQAFHAVHSVTNFGEDDKQSKTSMQKSAQAVSAVDGVKKEESIPTKLKAKMNLIAGRAQLLFTNPVANASLHLDARQRPTQTNIMSTADRAVVNMSKDINALKMKSDIKYGLERKVLEFNVSKPITDKISCNFTSQRFTSEQRNSAGVKSQESVNMTYSIHF